MPCPICKSQAERGDRGPTPHGRDGVQINCPRCGRYFISAIAAIQLDSEQRVDPDRTARLAHGVRKLQGADGTPFVTEELLQRFAAQPLPSVFEQAKLLTWWLGEHVAGPGETQNIEPHTHQFIIGAQSDKGFAFVVDYLLDVGYLSGSNSRFLGAPYRRNDVTLTFKGWEYFGQLQRGAVESRKAFMAMEFGDAVLDSLVDTILRPAVAQTGFELTRLDDRPRAGLIDDRLRVEIRTSRFLIADLTHHNAGAYWEAGYAEGLGKQVIYLCEREVFDRDKTHFDANHHLTVLWDATNPADAGNRLKETIRATFPDEAKLAD